MAELKGDPSAFEFPINGVAVVRLGSTARVAELESWDRPHCDLGLTLSLWGCLFFCKEKGVIIVLS